jgi:hypothetical protein
MYGLIIVAAAAAVAAGVVPYPEGYRDWHHVKSMVIEAGHPLYASFGGLHHLYANDKAMQGYRTGKFPRKAAITSSVAIAIEASPLPVRRAQARRA